MVATKYGITTVEIQENYMNNVTTLDETVQVTVTTASIKKELNLNGYTTMVDGDIVAQTEQIVKNIGAVLKAADMGFENVVKTTCFLAEMADFATFNAVYEKYFISKPARSCVAAKELPKGALAEIEIIAVK